MIEIRHIYHRQSEHLGLYFAYDKLTIEKVKALRDRKYSKTLKCWYIPCNTQSYTELAALGIPLKFDKSPANAYSSEGQKAIPKWYNDIDNRLNNLTLERQRDILKAFRDHMLKLHYPGKMIREYIDKAVVLYDEELNNFNPRLLDTKEGPFNKSILHFLDAREKSNGTKPG